MNEANLKSARTMLAFGAMILGLAVALGAIGSHALESYLSKSISNTESVASDDASETTRGIDSDKRLANWETAVRYQTYHGFGLIVLGLICRFHRDRFLTLAFCFFLVGIVLFSGMLYGWVLTQNKVFVMLVPIGGLSFIAGWVCSCISFLRIK